MSYQLEQFVSYKDSSNLDAFSRLRVSQPHILFNCQFQYDLQPLLWESTVTGGGTVTHLPAYSSVSLNTVLTTISSATYQTREYFRYYPGRSQLAFLSFVLGSASTGTTKRVGMYDAANGLFLTQSAAGVISLVKRSSGSGVPVDTAVAQTSWNLDKLNGTGKSGLTLDPTQVQILVLDAQWLGAGRVRIGFDIGGSIVYVHEFAHANLIATPYLTTLNLPIRVEIVNDGTGPVKTLTLICAAVMSEGAEVEPGYPFAASNGTTPVLAANGTQTGLLAIRPKDTFNGIVNRASIYPFMVNVMAGAAAITVQVQYRPVITVGGAWTSVGADSVVEFNTGITAISTPGQIVDTFFVGATGGGDRYSASTEVLGRLSLTLNAAGTAGSGGIMLVSAAGVGGTSASLAAIHWHEQR